MTGREDIFQKAMSQGHSAAWDQEWDKAAAAYRKALDEIPNNPKALSSLGLALFELERYDESLQVYQKAAQVATNDPVPLEKIGQLSERLGKTKEAVQAYLQAAELYIRNQESEKALEDWVCVTQLDSDNIAARSYLAMVHERLGHAQQAVHEYLAVASLFQRTGEGSKAVEMIGRAQHLLPNNAEVKQAMSMIKSGQMLPRPMRPQGGTGPLRMAQVKQLQGPKTTPDSGLDPIAEARKKALTRLAEVLFELSEEAGSSPSSKAGMQAIVKGTGSLSLKNDRNKMMLHIGQAIDSQTKEDDAQAAEELERAQTAGFADPALYFDLGLLRSKSERLESAVRHLQNAVKHDDYALGARLLLGQLHRQMGRLPEAVTEYLEALKLADSSVVSPEQAAEIRQSYEPLIEAQTHEADPANMEKLCDNIQQMLLRPRWRAAVMQAREQLPKPEKGMPPAALAEMLTQAQSSEVIEAIGRVRQLARAGHLRSAMDEAFESLKYGPTYLPLHTLIGDLLIEEGRTQDAITKYTVIAQAYSVRGEVTQAINLFRRIVKVAPMDLGARNRLIEQLTARGQVDQAIGEYLDLADIYYRLAELDMARSTYTTALRFAQQGGANRAWSVKLLQRMADIDMQRLDWRQALRLFEQLRTLEPDDAQVRKNLLDLNLRLNQLPQAVDELEGYLTHLQSNGRRKESIPFLEDLVKEFPQQAILCYALAEEYRGANRLEEAIAQLDTLGESLLNAGDKDGAVQAIEAIIAMNPPNKVDYQTLLANIKGGA
jgi:tetratricopeptide (TPR) repeat protein